MEDGSSFDYHEDQTIVTGGRSNMLFLGSLGAILMVASRIPSLMFNIELMNNVVQSLTITWALYMTLGLLIALVAGILIGLGLMALMKRYDKPYGPILFLAVVVPGLVSQFTMFQITTPEQAIMSGLISSVVSIITSVIIGGGLLMIRSRSVKPNLTTITGILNIANPLSFMLSGILIMMIQDPSLAFLTYLLTGFGFLLIMNILYIILFYLEASTSAASTLDW